MTKPSTKFDSRYVVGVRGKEVFMLSQTSKAILMLLMTGSIFSYTELSEASGVPLNSLYVFCERLEKAKLLARKKVGRFTEISLKGGALTFPKVRIAR